MKNIGIEAATIYAFIFSESFRQKVPVFVMYIILVLLVCVITVSRAAVWLWHTIKREVGKWVSFPNS